MRIDVLTLFPEMCEAFFSSSIIGKARESNRVEIRCHDIRRYSTDPHKKVDDRPFGGGPGMVMMCQPVFDAVEAVEAEDARRPIRLLMTPQGERFHQQLAESLSGEARLLLIAGHYEGFDERIRQGLSPKEVSIGDYVLTGGESAAMVIVDAVVRLLPGVLGDAGSLSEESFALTEAQTRGLEYPQFTRPREFRGLSVPDVLTSGDHGRIRAWRKEEAIRRTAERRPDLHSG